MQIPGSEKFSARDDLFHNLTIAPGLNLHRRTESAPDPISYEVIRHRFWQINDEHCLSIKRVSGSPAVTEANDFNAAIYDEEGNIAFIGSYVIAHAGTMDMIIKWTLKHRSKNPGIQDGDMFICNDPWVGALHQNDAALICPVFWQGEIFCWVANALHQLDVGGVNPGSFSPDARDVFAEAALMPPTKIISRGEIISDIEDLYLRHSRVPTLMALDLRAQIAGNNIAKRRILEMIERYGAAMVKNVMKMEMETCGNQLSERLKSISDGEWSQTIYQEVAHTGDRQVYPVTLKMTKTGDQLLFDYSDAADNVGMINCTYGALRGGIISAILPMLCYDVPWAVGGFTKLIEVKTRRGTVVDADYPSGTSMGPLSGMWQAYNCAILCLAKMMDTHPELKKELLTTGMGSWPAINMLGVDQRGDLFINFVMEPLGGGWGARSFKDGLDTSGMQMSPGGTLPNVESTELFYPLIYLWRKEATDSGGAGKFRGGAGISVGFALHDTTQPSMTVFAIAGMVAPGAQGINGGYPGGAHQVLVKRESRIENVMREGKIPSSMNEVEGQLEVIHPKSTIFINPGEVFYFASQGGGGYGDPIDREPERVAEDVKNGYVSVAAAEEYYGVLLDGNYRVDLDRTERRRAEIHRERLNESGSV